MCRPESERKDDSLISRIRAIENKLESGEYSISSAKIPASEAATADEDEPAPVLNISVPDDIKKVVSNWNEIIKRSSYPQKLYLAHAIPSLSEAGELIIAFEKNTDMVFFTSGDDYEQHFKILQDLINGYAGAEIRLRLAVNKQPGDVNGVSYPDLTKMDFFKEKGIKVEVVEDDEE
jgi:DNA polymerase-3 subunit gamma/tau